MGRWSAGIAVVLAGAFFLPSQVLAQQSVTQRCSADFQNPAQAEARLEWMRRCALTTKGHYLVDNGVPTATGGTLKDYVEQTSDPWTGMNSYTFQGDGFEINECYINKLYNSGATYQDIDPNGYYRWSRVASRKKQRPLYPIYGSQYGLGAGNSQLFPHPTLANCNFYYDRNGTQPASSPFYINGFCESVPSLTNGVPVSVSGNMGSELYYAIEVPAGSSNVVFETSGGVGDVDVYVRQGTMPDLSTFECRPYIGGNHESCNMRSPAAGIWYVMLKGYSSYSNAIIKATINRLMDDEPTPVFSGAMSSEQRWTMEVPAGMSRLAFTLAGAAGTSGDADLYVKHGSAATVSDFDCRPYYGSNNEECVFNAPAAGTWHVMVRGYSAYSQVTVTGDYSVNLALGMPTYQSTIAADGYPQRAVDGNTDGNYGAASTTHTAESFQPWWQVDLLSWRWIGTVVLHNRTDCCWERLNNFKLMLSDDGYYWQEYAHPGVANQQTSFTVNRTARYVRVQLNGQGILSLAEVQVFGRP